MKGQQLFHSFLPGVTAAVLTTQPAWASTLKVGGVQLASSPSVLIATDTRASVTDRINNKLAKTGIDSYPATVPTPDFTNLSLKPVDESSRPDIVDGNNISLPVPTIPKTVLPISVTDAKVAQQPDASKCLKIDKKSQAALLQALRGCPQKKAPNQQVAQVTIPSESGTPNSSQQPVQNSETVKPATTGSIETHQNLNPSSNPLLFPTKSEEVTVKINQPITLAQALELAKRNNNDLQVSVLQLERSKASLKEQQAALLPTLGLTGSVANSLNSSNVLAAKEQQKITPNYPDVTSNTSFSGQAQLNYNIYTSGKRNAAIQQAEEQVRFQELDVERESEDIRQNVSKDYYNLQQQDEQVRISKSAVNNSEASLRDAEALERAGVGTQFDVLRSQVNLANSQQNLTNAISQQQIARRQLATRINISESVNLSAADPVQLAGLWQQTLEQTIILAFQNRPELQQQLAQRNISEQQRRQALASLGPQVSLIASYNLLDQFNDNIPANDGYSLGVQATLNLYDGGAAKAQAAQAKSNIAIAETNFAEQRNQIRFQVEQAYSTQLANLENIQTANVALEQAKESLRLARLRFQAGVGTQTDVINSENDLTTAEGNRVSAILTYNRALVDLQRYVTSRAFNK